MLEQMQETLIEPSGPYEGLFDNKPEVRLSTI